MNIEDQLHKLDVERNATGDWDDVIARADRRADKQQLHGRIAIGLFLLLGLAGLLLAQGSGVETVDVPDDFAEPIDNVSAGKHSPSAFHVLSVLLLSWGGAAVVFAITFFATPQRSRAPFSPARVARLINAALRSSMWTGSVAVLAGAVLLLWDNNWVNDLHQQAGWALVVALIAMALARSATLDSTVGAVVYFVLLAFAVQVSGLIFASSGSGLADGRWLGALTHLGLSALAGWIVVALFRRVELPIDRARLDIDALRKLSWQRIGGALLILGGLIFAVISIAPAVVLYQQLQNVLPQVDGFDRTIVAYESNPVLDNDLAMNPVRVDYQRQLTRTPVNTSEFLDGLGFTKIDEGFESVRVSSISSYRRPRSDRFGAVIIADTGPTMNGSLFFIKVEDTSSLDIARSRMRFGVLVAIAGVIVLWSEMAVSRYAVGNFSVPRQGRTREILGWLVIGATVVGLANWVVTSQTSNLFAVIVLALCGWGLGAKLLVPDVRKHAAAAKAKARSQGLYDDPTDS